ncbi:MAG TPA: GNAT family N-acetyltransferase [Longimicrobiales bacterium]|nr:GNAT family N-acetyltransferase [Longimicrobiales bacterium]
MIELRDTIADDIPHIAALESAHGDNFVMPYSLERHYRELDRPEVLYKSVYRGSDLIGFAILVLDPDGCSVEFRRIVIADAGRGYGSMVVSMISDVARHDLGRARLWLDVFEDNARARRIYERLGYRRFGQTDHEGRVLLLYEQIL